MKNFIEFKDSFLENHSSRDIIRDLAKPMGFEVFCVASDFDERIKEFFAITIMNKDTRMIMINREKLNNTKTLKFILSYQLAEVIISNKEELYSIFEIENIDLEVYKLAKIIFEKNNVNGKKLIKILGDK